VFAKKIELTYALHVVSMLARECNKVEGFYSGVYIGRGLQNLVYALHRHFSISVKYFGVTSAMKPLHKC
jgi:hypothetical protein